MCRFRLVLQRDRTLLRRVVIVLVSVVFRGIMGVGVLRRVRVTRVICYGVFRVLCLTTIVLVFDVVCVVCVSVVLMTLLPVISGRLGIVLCMVWTVD